MGSEPLNKFFSGLFVCVYDAKIKIYDYGQYISDAWCWNFVLNHASLSRATNDTYEELFIIIA